ncbi:MAG: hypothetical protein GY810_02030 [Aureispira sp.]|nr:hypothetical protein [Aureispira sp.]
MKLMYLLTIPLFIVSSIVSGWEAVPITVSKTEVTSSTKEAPPVERKKAKKKKRKRKHKHRKRPQNENVLRPWVGALLLSLSPIPAGAAIAFFMTAPIIYLSTFLVSRSLDFFWVGRLMFCFSINYCEHCYVC